MEWAVRVPPNRGCEGNPFFWRLGRRNPSGPGGESESHKPSSETREEKVQGSLFFWQGFVVNPAVPSPHLISTSEKAVYGKSWNSIESSVPLYSLLVGQGWWAASDVFPVLVRMSLVDSLVFQVLVQDQGCLLPWAGNGVNSVTPAQSRGAFPFHGVCGYYVFRAWASLSKLGINASNQKINYNNVWKWRTLVSWPANEGINYTKSAPHLASFWLGSRQISREI